MKDHYSYQGSHLFLWATELTGISVDQINFVLSQVVALTLACLFPIVLHPSKANATVRHCFGLILGLVLSFFCFGKQALHLTVLPTLCFILMRTLSPRVIHRWVIIVSLFYLSCVHLRRQIFEYGSYTLDITGPLMVMVQKATTLAFNIHDGFTKTDSELNNSQQYYAVKKMPSFIEYFSYMFLFSTLMVGPLIYFRDYMDFINGSSFASQMNIDNKSSTNTVVIEPSPRKAIINKVIISTLCAIVFVKFLPMYPIKRVKEDNFVESTSLLYKFLYLFMSTTLVRCKYYFAWTLSDAICNGAGLGFNGYDEKGEPKWNKYSNVDIIGFEFSTNLRGSIEAWNIGTNSWLRMIVYDRTTKYRTVLTYALSALWHGFYPGYYLTFASGALFTFAARSVRKTIRPYFVNSEHKVFYDVITFITTRLVMAYITFTFVLLEFWPSVRLYTHMFWCLHLMGLAAIILLPRLFPKVSTGQPSKVHTSKIAEALTQAGTLRDGVSRHHD